MDPDRVPSYTFETLVVDAIDALPDWVQPILAEIPILVEDQVPRDQSNPGTLCLGVYRGVSRTQHPGRVPGSLPNTITLYRVPILLDCERIELLPRRIRTVLGHEVGHAMGLPESRLRALGWY